MLDYTYEDWKSRASALQFRNQAFINGQFVGAALGETFDCVKPATGQILAKVASCEAFRQ